MVTCRPGACLADYVRTQGTGSEILPAFLAEPLAGADEGREGYRKVRAPECWAEKAGRMADVLTTVDAAHDKTSAPLLRAVGISKTYRTPDHIGRLVLERVDFTLLDGEIVAVLGR